MGEKEGRTEGRDGGREGGLTYLGDGSEAFVGGKTLGIERNPLVELTRPHVKVNLKEGGREGGREGG